MRGLLEVEDIKMSTVNDPPVDQMQTPKSCGLSVRLTVLATISRLHG